MKIKLLYILNVANRFNNFSYSSYLAAKRLGIEFHIAGNWADYTSKEDRIVDEQKYGIRIHQIDFVRNPYNPKNIKAYRQVVELINNEKFDYIHCNTPIGGVVGRMAGRMCGARKIIYQAHGFHFYKSAPVLNWLFYYPVERLLAHITDAIVTINQEDYRRASSFRLHHNGNVYLVPGVGIDTTAYKPCNSRINIREVLGIPNSSIVLISIGELNSNKNNIVIIEALKKLENLDTHYIICGEGPLKDAIREKAKSIEQRVHFLGFRTDIKELLYASDIFVMPSKREGLSRSLMEAMACGLPCVVSKIRGNTDLIVENKGGYLLEPDDILGWKERLYDLIIDETRRADFGKYNRSAINYFSLPTVVDAITEIYKAEFCPAISIEDTVINSSDDENNIFVK